MDTAWQRLLRFGVVPCASLYSPVRLPWLCLGDCLWEGMHVACGCNMTYETNDILAGQEDRLQAYVWGMCRWGDCRDSVPVCMRNV